MTKSAIAKALAIEFEIKQKTASEVISRLAYHTAKEVKRVGRATVPGLVRIKAHVKPATKACKKEKFGKKVQVKAKPARTIVKAIPVAKFKKAVEKEEKEEEAGAEEAAEAEAAEAEESDSDYDAALARCAFALAFALGV